MLKSELDPEEDFRQFVIHFADGATTSGEASLSDLSAAMNSAATDGLYVIKTSDGGFLITAVQSVRMIEIQSSEDEDASVQSPELRVPSDLSH